MTGGDSGYSDRPVRAEAQDARWRMWPGGLRSLRSHGWLGFRNISAIYVWVALIATFAAWEPAIFVKYQTFTGVLNDGAVTGLVALSLVLPLAAGVFDLSVGYTLGATSVSVAWLLGNTGLGVSACIALSLAFGALIGVVNAVVVVVFGIDSFIGTLATGSLLQAVILIISGDQNLTQGVNSSFRNVAQDSYHGITVPVVYMFVIATLLWFLLGHTAQGRFVYATGLGREAARLAGIRTDLIRFLSLVASATIAGAAGIVLTATVGAGSPTVGPPYLIPAFAAAFLGATQFNGGLFNAWGTVVAVLLLGTANTGLALAGVPIWTPYVFTGTVLIIALGLGGLQRRSREPPDEASTTGDAEP